MKKPVVIGLFSIVPGLGLIVLGKVLMGLGVMAIITLLVYICLVAPWEIILGTSIILGLIIWVLQGYYAVVVAHRLARAEAGFALPVRQAPIAAVPPEASSGERLLHKARETVMQLLQPGEHLKVALQGTTGMRSLASTLLDLVVPTYGTSSSDQEVRQVYFGITEQDFIFVKTDPFGMPSELQRIPLSQVSLVKSTEGLLSDEVVIDIGETKPLRVGVGRPMRQGTQQLIGILSGKEHDRIDIEKLFRQDRLFAAGEHRVTPSTSPAPGIQSKHPILLSALLGASGGIMGTVAAAVLSMTIGLFLGDAFIGSSQPSGFAEGLGYLLGSYCLIMFPLGGALLGAIPGAIVGALRISWARKMTLIPPLLAGFLTVVILTLVAFVAMLVLSAQGG